MDDRKDYGELRYISIGMVDNVAVVVVAHNDGDGQVGTPSGPVEVGRPLDRRADYGAIGRSVGK